MRNLKLFAVALITLLSINVQAEDGDSYIYTGGWSYHFEQDKYPVDTQTHDLIGFQYKSYMVGTYHNSYDHVAYIVAKEFKFFRVGDFQVGALVGADYGYGSCTRYHNNNTDEKWCPAIMPSITYDKYFLQPSVAIMGRAITAGFRWNW